MRTHLRSAALIAAALVPVAATGWSGVAQAAPASPQSSGPCDPDDWQVKFKADMPYHTYGPDGGVDTSNVAGHVALEFNANCDWTRAAVTLNNPLPSGKIGWGRVSTVDATVYEDCDIPVGGQSCVTIAISDWQRYSLADAEVTTPNSYAAPYWYGATQAY
ncbi:MAG: hypothetical protein ACQSGP_27900 [Frankia sp.]